MKCSEENEVLRGIFRVVSCFHISCYSSEILITFWTVYDQLRQYNRHCLSCYQVFDFVMAVTRFYPFIFFWISTLSSVSFTYQLFITFSSTFILYSCLILSFSHSFWFLFFLCAFLFSICSVNFLIKTTLMIFYYTL